MAKWKARIKKATQDAGTYRPYFDSVIDTLASIMEMRDDALRKFNELGGDTVIIHTNKGGQSNVVKNPALVVVDDMNKTALQYWRDLGLTPAGLRRIDDELMKEKKSSFADALKDLGI